MLEILKLTSGYERSEVLKPFDNTFKAVCNIISKQDPTKDGPCYVLDFSKNAVVSILEANIADILSGDYSFLNSIYNEDSYDLIKDISYKSFLDSSHFCEDSKWWYQLKEKIVKSLKSGLAYMQFEKSNKRLEFLESTINLMLQTIEKVEFISQTEEELYNDIFLLQSMIKYSEFIKTNGPDFFVDTYVADEIKTNLEKMYFWKNKLTLEYRNYCFEFAKIEHFLESFIDKVIVVPSKDKCKILMHLVPLKDNSTKEMINEKFKKYALFELEMDEYFLEHTPNNWIIFDSRYFL